MKSDSQPQSDCSETESVGVGLSSKVDGVGRADWAGSVWVQLGSVGGRLGIRVGEVGEAGWWVL